jgi:hypothetical protein
VVKNAVAAAGPPGVDGLPEGGVGGEVPDQPSGADAKRSGRLGQAELVLVKLIEDRR